MDLASDGALKYGTYTHKYIPNDCLSGAGSGSQLPAPTLEREYGLGLASVVRRARQDWNGRSLGGRVTRMDERGVGEARTGAGVVSTIMLYFG